MLVILVARDGAAWLPRCLAGLSRQTHPRMGVIGVDSGSTDGSAELMATALGPERVIRLDRNLGFAAAVDRALTEPVARRADFFLLLHDDTVLAPDAVARLLEAATRVSGAGVVGPKVLDWEEPQVLRDIGLSTDRFGYPYSPLEDGEIDQGQYDRIREVRFVSSCAMLISHEALARVGRPDERLTSRFEDLDLCWRAQIAGFRVLMTPAAVARHRGPTVLKDRMGAAESDRSRYERERAALLCMLKNYGALSLAWVLPLFLTLGLARVALFALTRRFGDAYQVLAAWGWNVTHLPGTVRRRVRAQAVRIVPDRSVRRSMAPMGVRLRRWGTVAAQTMLPRRGQAATGPRPSPWRRVSGFMLSHPVGTAWATAVLLALIAYRHLWGASPLMGGAALRFPASATAFFRELFSGVRHDALGGTQAASPALAILGGGSILAFGSPALLQKALLLGLPVAAGLGCYRAVGRITGDRVSSVVAAAAYGLSGVVLWAVSQGRLGPLVLLAGLPWLATKIPLAFDPLSPIRPARWICGTAAGIAVLGSFYPGVVLAAAVLAVSSLAGRRDGTRRGRGLALVAMAGAAAAVLAFPLSISLFRAGQSSLWDPAGRASFASLVRLSPGPAPGAWPAGFFLPAAAALSLVFVSRRHGQVAVRAALASLASLYLAWAAAAGWLPAALSNPVAYLSVAAFSDALLVGLGLASLTLGMTRASFGARQLGVAVLCVALAGGLGAQAFQAARGGWDIGGPDRVRPAYLVVQQQAGPYRVLWLGGRSAAAFPAPGGTAQGTLSAGPSSIRFGLTGPAGDSVFGLGRPAAGPGYTALSRSLQRILAGPTEHGGALLAPFAIRYIVAEPGALPPPALRALSRQVDLDTIPTQGLTIFRDPKAVPVASLVDDAQWQRSWSGPSDPDAVAQLPPARTRPLLPDGDGYRSASPAGSGDLALLAQQFDSRWTLDTAAGARARAAPAFGWAVGLRAPEDGALRIRFTGQLLRTVEIWLLAGLWMAALWMTRRPSGG